MADVLISGGGVAGSAAAILLARQGRSVDLFECGTFPKEKPCGEGIMPGGIAVLERMGLAEAVGGEPFIGVRYHFGNQTAQATVPLHQRHTVVGRALPPLAPGSSSFRGGENDARCYCAYQCAGGTAAT